MNFRIEKLDSPKGLRWIGVVLRGLIVTVLAATATPLDAPSPWYRYRLVAQIESAGEVLLISLHLTKTGAENECARFVRELGHYGAAEMKRRLSDRPILER